MIRAKRRIKHWLTFRFITSLILLFNFLSRGDAIVLGKVLGRWAFFLQKDARRTTLRNLKFALGKIKKEREIKKIAWQTFENIGKNIADVARFPKLTLSEVDRIVQAEGLKHLDTAYKRGKGVIVLTGHIGNFELIGAYLSLKGYKISAVGRDVYDPRLNKLLIRNRESVGVENISSTGDVKKIIKVLRAGRTLGVLADQDSTRVKGTFVNFFGKAARTPVGPAFLNLKLGSPIIPMALLRNKNEKYKIIVKPALELQPTGDKSRDVKDLTQKYTEVLEKIIREYPSQWVWMHKRWKSRPASSG
ncbi:MAG: lysophospholipid acyltransferase family protein [Candidatus Zixiibacteriota bacterium]